MKLEVHPGSAGLTLLEMLIALFLTSLLSLVAFASLNLSLRAVSRGQIDAETLQQLRISQSLLERSISSAVPWIAVEKKRTNYFEGGPQDLRFITTVPLAAHDLGGLYHIRIYASFSRSSQALTVEQSKMIQKASNPPESEVRKVLIPNLSDFRFNYGSGGQSWETWEGSKQGHLPEWVKIHLTVPGYAPQTWFILIHTNER